MHSCWIPNPSTSTAITPSCSHGEPEAGPNWTSLSNTSPCETRRAMGQCSDDDVLEVISDDRSPCTTSQPFVRGKDMTVMSIESLKGFHIHRE